MKNLSFGMKADGKPFMLPLDAATQTFAFIARKGGGKTYAAGKLVELMLTAGIQCVILDTVGNWYGLRLAAEGGKSDFDIPVLGGLRGDIPLEASSGELVADLVTDTGRSVIIDVAQFSQSERKRFAAAFGARLWQRKKADRDPSPLHLVIEESQLIIPQNVRADDARMVGIFEEIVRLGRNYGIGVSMISQRPQSVNKEVLTQTECLVVLQVNGAQERKALREWIVHQGMEPELLAELPSLKVGTAYIWSPQWLGVLEKVAIGRKVTLDASATPKAGSRGGKRELAPLDLDALREKMAAVIERAQAADPAVLQRKVKELEMLVHKQTAEIGQQSQDISLLKARIDAEYARGWSAAVKGAQVSAERTALALDALATAWKEHVARLETASAKNIVDAVVPAEGLRRLPASVATGQYKAPPTGHGRGAARVMVSSDDATFPVKYKPQREAGILRGGKLRMLVALAQFRAGLTGSKLSLLTGISQKGGTWRTYMGELKAAGLVEGDRQHFEITGAGLEQVGEYERLPQGAALLDYWRGRLGNGGMLRIFNYLAEKYPTWHPRDDVARSSGIDIAGGTWRTYLGELRSLELVDAQANMLRLSADLFS